MLLLLSRAQQVDVIPQRVYFNGPEAISGFVAELQNFVQLRGSYLQLTYTASESTSETLRALDSGEANIGVVTESIDAADFRTKYAQAPLLGEALALVHNIATVTGTTLTTRTGAPRLDRQTVVDIFLGRITNWGHANITSRSPGFSSTEAIEVLVPEPGSTLELMLTRALSKFDSTGLFDAQVGVGNNVTWPLPFNTSANPASDVLLGSGRFSIDTRHAAMTAETQFTDMYNINNYHSTLFTPYCWLPQVVTAAALFPDATATEDRLIDLDIMDKGCATCWPIAYFYHMVLPMEANPTACGAMSTLLNLMDEYFSSKVIEDELQLTLGYVMLAPKLRGMARRPLELTTCKGDLTKSRRSMVGGGEAAHLIHLSQAELSALGVKVTSTFQPVGSTLSATSLADNSFDYEIHLAHDRYEGVANVTTIPLAADAVTVGLSLPGVSFGTGPREIPSMNLTLSTLADIFAGNITDWAHPSIYDPNPNVQAAIDSLVSANKSAIRLVAVTQPDEATRELIRGFTLERPDVWPAVESSSLFPRAPSVTPVPFHPQKINAMANLKKAGFGSMTPTFFTSAIAASLGVTAIATAAEPTYVYPTSETIQAAVLASIAQEQPSAAARSGTAYWTDLMMKPGAYPLCMYAYISLRNRPTSASQMSEDFLKNAVTFAELLTYSPDRAAFITEAFFSPVPDVALPNVRLALASIRSFDGQAFLAPSGACFDTNGTVCSMHGQCINGACECDSDWEGSTCESAVPESESNSADLTAVLVGTIVPYVVIFGALIGVCVAIVIVGIVILVFGIMLVMAALLLVALIVGAIAIVGVVGAGVPAALFTMMRRQRTQMACIEVPFEQLELERVIGSGAFGEVYRGFWNDNEVAVKVMFSDKISKKSIVEFRREMAVMQSLRHPNLLIQMGASTRPPNMAIVMEYMALGSMYDIIHNPEYDLPLSLRLEMARDLVEGVAFLHSLDIVHRDIKSLNVLVNAQFQVKVSDFGLSAVKAELGSNAGAVEGSILWMAPEVMLDGTASTDSDVYSVGMVIWELMSLQEPFSGMALPTVVHVVSRFGQRPDIPASCPEHVATLITDCWAQNPASRPKIGEVRSRLRDIVGSSTGGGSTGNRPSTRTMTHAARSEGTDRMASSASAGSHGSGDHVGTQFAAIGQSAVRTGSKAVEAFSTVEVPTVVFDAPAASDAPASLTGEDIQDAATSFTEALREQIKRHGGFETTVADIESDVELHEAAIECAANAPIMIVAVFPNATMAVSYIRRSLAAIAKLPWSSTCAETFKPSVSVGYGKVLTRRMHFFSSRVMSCGAGLDEAVCLSMYASPGAVISFEAFAGEAKKAGSSSSAMGQADLGDGVIGNVMVLDLGEAQDQDADIDEVREGRKKKTGIVVVSQADLSVREKLGWGEHGVSHRCTFDGVTAVYKKIGRLPPGQSSQMAFLGDISRVHDMDHPNVLRVKAATLKPAGFVTDMAKTSLHALINSGSAPSYTVAAKILNGIASGLDFLHANGIVHANIKPTNVLLDAKNTVKLADFLLPTLGGQTCTRTEAALPYWMAPELISGQLKPSPASDIYAVGIVMLQLLIHSERPFPTSTLANFVAGILDDSIKPARVPGSVPKWLADLITSCYAHDPSNRPSTSDIINVIASN